MRLYILHMNNSLPVIIIMELLLLILILVVVVVVVVVVVWLNGRAFARDPKGRGFESRPVRFQVTALGKLLTRMCLCQQAVQFGPADRR